MATCSILLAAGGLAACGEAGGGYDPGYFSAGGKGRSYTPPSKAPASSPAPSQPQPTPAAPAADNQGDEYAAVGTNPFVSAAADPYSTFAADVDTASYDIFRRDVGFGLLPVPEGVRLEEHVNFFSYGYAQPPSGSDIPFAISLEAAPTPFYMGRKMLRVGIKGRALSNEAKKPANLVFLVDVSGSMSSANKLPLVKVILTEALDVLDPSDTLSIVTYAGTTGVAMPPTPIAKKAEIKAKIASFTSGGSTYGSGGLQLAYAQAEAAFIPGGINHVLLCTDGDFNVGVVGTEALVDLIEQKRKTGITLTVLGFGIGNLNDAMMEAITNSGNGTYSVITDTDQAISYANHKLLSNLTYIAKDMKIQVVFNPARVQAYRLLGYENRAIADEDFVDDTVDAGEVGAGHTVTALYEVVLKGQELPWATGAPAVEEGPPFTGEIEVMPEELARVLVRWKDPDAGEEDPAKKTAAAIEPHEVRASFGQASKDFRWAATVAAFAEVLKGSPYAGVGHLGAMLQAAKADTGGDPDREEYVALLQNAIWALAK